MKVTLFVRESRAKSSKGSAQLPLIICFRSGKMNLWQTTRLSVNPDWWDQNHQQLKARMVFNPKQRQEFDNEVATIRKYVSDAFYACKDPSAINHDWLERVVKKYYKEKVTQQKEPVQPVQDFVTLFDAFLDSKMRADSRRKQYLVVKRMLQRYELYKRFTGKPRYRLDIKSIDQTAMEDIAAYMRSEPSLAEPFKPLSERKEVFFTLFSISSTISEYHYIEIQ